MLPRKMRPIRLSRRSEPFDSDQFIFELKIDGFRALAHIENGQGKLISRNGNVFRGFADLATWIAEHLKVESAVVDGEIACVDDAGRPVFRDLLFRRRQCVFIAFDLLYLNGEDPRTLPLLPQSIGSGISSPPVLQGERHRIRPLPKGRASVRIHSFTTGSPDDQENAATSFCRPSMEHRHCGDRVCARQAVLARHRRNGPEGQSDLSGRFRPYFSSHFSDHWNPLALAHADAWHSDKSCKSIRPEYGGGFLQHVYAGLDRRRCAEGLLRLEIHGHAHPRGNERYR